MATATPTTLVQRQVDGLNAGKLEDVVSVYADDATLTLFSPHTLPGGSQLKLEGREKIERHMGRVISGGIADVEIDSVEAGDGFVTWIDHGSFGNGIDFSEGHFARLDGDGKVVDHVIHSVYGRAPKG